MVEFVRRHWFVGVIALAAIVGWELTGAATDWWDGRYNRAFGEGYTVAQVAGTCARQKSLEGCPEFSACLQEPEKERHVVDAATGPGARAAQVVPVLMVAGRTAGDRIDAVGGEQEEALASRQFRPLPRGAGAFTRVSVTRAAPSCCRQDRSRCSLQRRACSPLQIPSASSEMDCTTPVGKPCRSPRLAHKTISVTAAAVHKRKDRWPTYS